MVDIRKVRRDGGSTVMTIPPALGYKDGDHVMIEERVKGMSFMATKVTKATTDAGRT